MIKGVNFDNQLVTAKQHGALFRAAFGDGILSGMDINVSGKTITIGAGYCVVAGREIQLTATETVSVTATSGYARVLMQIDLSQTATESAFSQASLVLQTATSQDGFSALTQDDINGGGTVYQIVLCVVQCGSSLTLLSKAPNAAHPITVGTDAPSGGSDGDIYIQYEG